MSDSPLELLGIAFVASIPVGILILLGLLFRHWESVAAHLPWAERDEHKPSVPAAIEYIAAILLLQANCIVLGILCFGDTRSAEIDGSTPVKFFFVVAWAASFVLLLPPLLLLRFVRSPLLYAVLALGWILGVSYFEYNSIHRQVFMDAYEAFAAIGVTPGIQVPFTYDIVNQVMLTVVPLIAAISLASARGRLRAIIPAVLLVGVVILSLAKPFTLGLSGSLKAIWAFVPLACLGSALVLLPGWRESLEKLLNRPLSGHSSPWPLRKPMRRISMLGLQSVLFPIPFVLVFSAAVDFRMQRLVLFFGDGIPQPLRRPAEVNGWDFLRDYFTHTRPESFQSVSLPVISKLHANNTPAEEIDLWTTPTLAQLQIAEVNYASRFEAVDRLRGADYLRYYHDGKSETPSFLALREVARAMYIRARYDLHQGKSERPLHDCESLILLGGLMRHGNLVEHMIGVAIRGIAVDVGHAILVRRRDDRPVVRELLETLEKHRHLWASGLDYDDLRRNEPGFWPIVPMAEIVTPSFQRADTITIRNWSQMEQLRIAAALELYRLDHGDYPEELFLLAPEYLPAIPRDPFRGDEYVYIPGEGGFFELSVTTAEEKLHEPLEFPYPEWVKE